MSDSDPTTYDFQPEPPTTAIDDASMDRPASKPPWWYAWWFLPSTLAVIVLGLFGRLLFNISGVIASDPTGDVATAFVYFRKFGVDQLRAGHPALWNSHIFSGTPFIGNWQSALMYPLNWIYFVLPLGSALNVEVVLNLFLGGLGTAWWTRRRGLHPAACLFAGALWMLGGMTFMNVYAGHWASIDAMAWIPFLIMSIDELFDATVAGRRVSTFRWGLVACGSMALMVLAGHPQTVYNTVLTVVIYGVIRLIRTPKAWPTAIVLAVAAVGALAMSAAQIDAGLAAAAEGTRRTGASYTFASMIAFPPENFLTMIAPRFFGGATSGNYWGRWYSWEVSFFVGVVGLLLAKLGAVRGAVKERWAWAITAVLLIVLALGQYTPLYHFLYYHLPGFDRFRGVARFLCQSTLFIAALAGAGMDRLIRGETKKVLVVLGVIAAIVGAGLTSFGLVLRNLGLGAANGSTWEGQLRAVHATHQTFSQSTEIDNTAFFVSSQTLAGTSCLLPGLTAIVLAVLLCGSIRVRRLAYGVLVLGLVELCVFANANFSTFELASTSANVLNRMVTENPGDYRVVQVHLPRQNRAMLTSTSELWGYDPTVLGRYSEYMAYSQGQNPNDASMYLKYDHLSRMMMLFRLKYAFENTAQGVRLVTIPTVLPHAFLAERAVGAYTRDGILAAVGAPGFDFQQCAYLEMKEPPSITEGASGTVNAVEDYPGRLTVTADVPGNALAVITDPYSRDWHATAVDSGRSYDVLPVDYAAMGIPLTPGHHVIRLEYMPSTYPAALVVSRVASVLYLVLVCVALSRRKVGLRSRIHT